MPSRKAPPPVPTDDKPPPVPQRPGMRNNPPIANAPPPPAQNDLPPALPQRPSRNPPPVEEAFYEDVNGLAPAIISVVPKHKPIKSAISPPRHAPPEPLFEETNAEYEEPLTFQGGARANVNVAHHTQFEHKRFDEEVGQDYEDEDQWPDEDWDDDEATTHTEDPIMEDIYEFPEENAQLQEVDEGFYMQEDPITPQTDLESPPKLTTTPDTQDSQRQVMFNPADLQMQRLNLTNRTGGNNNNSNSMTPANTSAKSPPPTTTHHCSDSTASSSVSKFKKLFETSDKTTNNKPKPPPKPRQDISGKTNTALTPPPSSTPTPTTKSSSVVSPKSWTGAAALPNSFTYPDNDRKQNSRSDDNSSSGSVSSASGGQIFVIKKKSDNAEEPAVVDSDSSPPKPARMESINVEEDDGEIYDEASSMVDQYSAFEWYHGDISREEGKKRLVAFGKIGAFLIRISSKDHNFPYTLVVKLKNDIKNLQIRQRTDGTYAFGKDKGTDEIFFTSLNELVKHHKTNYVKVFRKVNGREEQDFVMLSQTPPKS